jgi:glucose/arabinose dehydrogenase
MIEATPTTIPTNSPTATSTATAAFEDPTPVPEDPTPTTPALPALESLTLQLVPVVSGFDQPVYVTHAGDGSGRIFVVEQPGRVQVVKDGQIGSQPFLDIASLVGSGGLEQGLLSLAFHPRYPENGYFFVNYTDRQGDTIIARYSVSDDPDAADPESAKQLLAIGQPYPNHNGGHILFGPGGYLYVGMGDGGSANDPENRAQDLGTLLGKILRLDVDNADPYGVPPTNPFVDRADARPEIWSYGWRNPWRLAFDTATGDMFIADVGQNQYEEVHVELAGQPGGLNYGWRLMEGSHCFNPAQCDPEALDVVLPVTEYDHGQGCSITGGYVYRGSQFPALNGVYLFGDYCRGTLWGIRFEANGGWSQTELLQTGRTISSFGQDEAGEIYLVDHDGAILWVTSTP